MTGWCAVILHPSLARYRFVPDSFFLSISIWFEVLADILGAIFCKYTQLAAELGATFSRTRSTFHRKRRVIAGDDRPYMKWNGMNGSGSSDLTFTCVSDQLLRMNSTSVITVCNISSVFVCCERLCVCATFVREMVKKKRLSYRTSSSRLRVQDLPSKIIYFCGSPSASLYTQTKSRRVESEVSRSKTRARRNTTSSSRGKTPLW